jgi:predicted Rossmann fold flavoprotein
MIDQRVIQLYDVIVIGAGAAGLMCAITAAQRGRKVIILDHANKMGKKILLSGGGRCNFTNRFTTDKNYLSNNKHFCKSALKRYTSQDFENLVQSSGLAYHEKTLGQLFCDESSKDILQLFKSLLDDYKIPVQLNTSVIVQKKDAIFIVKNETLEYHASSLVIATGGLSFPTMGASPFGYKIAEQFGLAVTPVTAGLVPLTLHTKELVFFKDLPGVSLPVTVTSQSGDSFKEAMLFTHRGLSGPAILQISNYWHPGESLTINLLPDANAIDLLLKTLAEQPNQSIKQFLGHHLPQRFASVLCEHYLTPKLLKQYTHSELVTISKLLNNFEIKPNGTEGYRTAEVTLGGVDTNEISSKSFESRRVPGLYFIGEVLDVTGHLGGFNFQWAWSSGYCAGLYV